MRISDWSSDVCSSDLHWVVVGRAPEQEQEVLSMKSLNRRHFIGAITAAAVSAGIGFPNIVRAPANARTILGLWPLAGPFGDVGSLPSVGAEVALGEAGDKSGDPHATGSASCQEGVSPYVWPARVAV